MKGALKLKGRSQCGMLSDSKPRGCGCGHGAQKHKHTEIKWPNEHLGARYSNFGKNSTKIQTIGLKITSSR